MEELIYTKIREYDSKLKNFEISYSNHPLVLDDLIALYKGRNKLAVEENVKITTLQILNILSLIKEKTSIEYIKFVIVRKDGFTRFFFFTDDYSTILSDYIFE